MEKKIEIALLIGVIVVLGFILVFYKNNIKQDSGFTGTYNERYELTSQSINSTSSSNQPQKVGSVTVKGGETNRVDIKEV